MYHRLERLKQEETLFTFLTVNPGKIMHATTNIAESRNAKIKNVLYQHRGLSEHHMIAAINWLVYYRSETPLAPKEIYTHWSNTGRPERHLLGHKRKPQPEQICPVAHDTGLSAEEGLWTRKGWARRSH